MIVSHEHRFIFVKTRKTAGTSVEVALSALAGVDAVVTPVDPPEADHEPRNWQGLFNPVPEVFDRLVRREPSLRDWSTRATLSNLRRRRAYWNHLPASVIRARVGAKVWDRYFTFCFERNPWDKVASWYFYVTRGNPTPPPFERWAMTAGLPSDWHLYTIDGSIGVDFVGQYDHLHDDLAKALREIGVDAEVELPRAKAQFRPDATRSTFAPALDERIRRVFAQEIDRFGYLPES